jgi:hypothetical protein
MSLLLGKIETRWHVEFIGVELAALVERRPWWVACGSLQWRRRAGGAVEMKAGGTVRWRGRLSGEKVGRRYIRGGGRDAWRSTVMGSQRCGEFIFFFL